MKVNWRDSVINPVREKGERGEKKKKGEKATYLGSKWCIGHPIRDIYHVCLEGVGTSQDVSFLLHIPSPYSFSVSNNELEKQRF